VTLEGPHNYISPSWYLSPGVPTWNYQTVHIYGHCEVVSDTGAIKSIVDSLTSIYESNFGVPWLPEYKESMLGAIVGLVVEINEIQCKYKLSQNRSPKERLIIINKLKEFGSKELAEAMVKNEL
jgi:transcriptional regulator